MDGGLNYKFKSDNDKAGKVEKDKTVWDTEKIEKLKVSISKGYEPKVSPFFERNINWKRGEIVFNYTDEEVAEIKRCKRDIIYFANKYCHVMTDEGIRQIILRDYQEQMLVNYQKNRFNITLASRQIGKTIVAAIYNCWYLCFHVDRNVLFLSDKGATTKEIIDKTKVIFEYLPFFMKPGVNKKDVLTINFDNGCRLVGQTTSDKAGIGFTIHVLYIDEFAHIPHNKINKFYENVYPTISSSQVSRIIITSTPNGFNKFYDIYKDAEDGKSEYNAFRVDWWQVPGRDDAWRLREISNLGGEEAFNMQYGNQFVSSGKLLFNSDQMKKLKAWQKEFKWFEFDELDEIELDYSQLTWDPDFDFDNMKESGNYYVVSVDVGEGVNNDHSVFNIFQLMNIDPKRFRYIEDLNNMNDFFQLKQVGVFRSNRYSTKEFTKILYTVVCEMMDPENVRIVLEYNSWGGEVYNHLFTVFPQRNEFYDEMVVRYAHTQKARTRKPGLKLRPDNKNIFCHELKNFVRADRLMIQETKTVDEAQQFSQIGNSYAGQMGNDDLIMTCVNVSTFFRTIDFSEFVEEMFDYIDGDIQIKIDKYLEDNELKGSEFNYNMYDVLDEINDEGWSVDEDDDEEPKFNQDEYMRREIMKKMNPAFVGDKL